MIPQRQLLIERLVEDAAAMGGPEREEFIAESCRGDPELRRWVDILLSSNAVAEIRPGRKLKNRYLVEEWLEPGGLGLLLKAIDTHLHGRAVVIKLMQNIPEERDYLEKKFATEVKALSLVDHPGVVMPLDAGSLANGMPYVVLQYIRGTTLQERLKEGPIALETASDLLAQIGAALQAAHDAGITHRDLKPSNIMLQPTVSGRFHVKLIDFGISTIGAQPASGEAYTRPAGSPPYMAPEQFLGAPSPASDVYALGIIAHEMVAGKKPFEWNTITELMRLQERGVNRIAGTLHGPVDPKVEALILRALKYRPEDRIVPAHRFCDELSAALLDWSRRPVELAPARMGQRNRARWLSPLPIGGGVLGVGALLAALWYVQGSGSNSPPAVASRPVTQPEAVAPAGQPAAPAPDPSRLAAEALAEGKKFDKAGRYRDAVRAYSKALAYGPGLAEAYFERAETYRRWQVPGRAIPDLLKAVELNPSYAQAYNSLGAAYLNQKTPDLDRAIHNYDKAVALAPGFVYAWNGRAYARFRKGDANGALGDANTAVHLDPKYANGYALRAQIRKALGDGAGAKADAGKAAKLRHKT